MVKNYKKIASIIWKRWDKGLLLEGLNKLTPKSLKDAYKAHGYLRHYANDEILGWKIAATSKLGQRHIGIKESLAGRLFAKKVLKNNAELSITGNLMLVAEPEFLLKLSCDIFPCSKTLRDSEIISIIDKVFIAIEVPNSRFNNFTKIGTESLIADNACANYLVFGEEFLENWRETDLAKLEVTISILEEGKVKKGKGFNVMGSPINAMKCLINELIKKNIKLFKGQIISTGICTVPISLKPNITLEAEISNLAKAKVSFIK